MSSAKLRPAVRAVPMLVLAAFGTGASTLADQDRPLPTPDPFFAAVRANLARSDREQYLFSYRERRSEVHTNPFGRLGTEGSLLYQVTPGSENGVYHRRLIERDGKPLGSEKSETVDRRGRSETNPAVDDVVTTLSFQIVRRETRGGRDFIVVHFTPKPGAKPKTRQGKMAKVFKGTVWVDESAREVARLEATAIDSLSYGLGVLARLNEGTRVTVHRQPIDSVWLPTSIQLSGEGRALLFRRLDVDYFIEWLDYRRAR